MHRTIVFYLLNQRKYRKLEYAEKVSDVEEWIRSNKVQIITDETFKNNKYKLVYFVEISEENDNYQKILKELYTLPDKLPFIYQVDNY